MIRLEALSEISQQGKRINGLFRLLENPILWHEAYANIYANKGVITPGVDNKTLDGFSEERVTSIMAQLKNEMPEAFHELDNIRKTLEKHFKDVQDFEFTIQEGKVFMLQTRNGKRTGPAAVRFAIEMEAEKLIDWKTAIRRVPAEQLDQLLAPVFDRKAVKDAKCIARGLPAVS